MRSQLLGTDEADREQAIRDRLCCLAELRRAATLQIPELDRLTDEEPKHTAVDVDWFDVVEPVTAQLRVVLAEVRGDLDPKVRLKPGHLDRPVADEAVVLPRRRILRPSRRRRSFGRCARHRRTVVHSRTRGSGRRSVSIPHGRRTDRVSLDWWLFKIPATGRSPTFGRERSETGNVVRDRSRVNRRRRDSRRHPRSRARPAPSIPLRELRCFPWCCPTRSLDGRSAACSSCGP